MPEEPQIQLSVAETCVLVNRYLREANRTPAGQPSLHEVADRLGWSVRTLTQFRTEYAALLSYEDAMAPASGTGDVASPEPVLPPSSAGILSLPDADDLTGPTPTDEDLARAVAVVDENMLQKGLMAMGLPESEAVEAEALQKFNRTHFQESMEMVASNGMRTSLRLAAEQRVVQGRLESTRKALADYGDFPSEERDYWVREERLLVRQFIELGQLINQIQETWFRGTAVLAMAKMRARGNTGVNGSVTQRSNKPSFRPVMDQ